MSDSTRDQIFNLVAAVGIVAGAILAIALFLMLIHTLWAMRPREE